MILPPGGQPKATDCLFHDRCLLCLEFNMITSAQRYLSSSLGRERRVALGRRAFVLARVEDGFIIHSR